MKSKVLRELGLGPWQQWSEAVNSTKQTAPITATEQNETNDLVPATEPLKTIKLVEDLAELAKIAKSCTSCKLCKTRTNVAFDRGVRNKNQVLVVGEGPGEQEDKTGLPFVGQAGQLLELMLASIGLNAKENINITNIVKCRPPNNRDPESEEVETCIAYLHQQIKLLEPKLIIAVGKVAAGTLLGLNKSMGDMRETVHEFANIPLIATYHPAYLLRSPKQKAKAWDDLLFIKHELD